MRQQRVVPRIAITIVYGIIASLLAIPSYAAQKPFSEWTDAEMETLLLNGKVVERDENDIGISQSDIVTLDDGKVQHTAQIQTIDERELRQRFQNGSIELSFTDRHTYNVAAYRLDRLIGLNMVPVAVPRRDGSQDAAYVWWVDDVQMSERERYEAGIQPPRGLEWNEQVNRKKVFKELIYDTDAHLGNMLITNDWQVWLIDFTRAFRMQQDLFAPEDLPLSLPRRVYSGLKSLTKAMLDEALKDLMTPSRIDAILARRDLIIEHFDSLIADPNRGENLVLLGD